MNIKFAELDKNLSKLGIQRVQVSEDIKAKLQVKKFSSIKEAQEYIEEANRSLTFERKVQGSAARRKGMSPNPNNSNPSVQRIIPWGMQPYGDFKYYEELTLGYPGLGVGARVRFSFDLDYNSQTSIYSYNNLSTFVDGFPIGWSWQERYISSSGNNHLPQFTIHGIINWGVQIAGVNIYYSQTITFIVNYDADFGIASVRSFFGTPTQTNP